MQRVSIRRRVKVAAVAAAIVGSTLGFSLPSASAVEFQEYPVEMNEGFMANCVWANLWYSPGAKVLSHGGVFECMSSGRWRQVR